VRDFTRAQQTFDQSRLAALTAESYFEISPIGEVDSRAKMLGFYAAENARPAPAMSVREEAIRRHGDFAIITSKLSYTVPGSAARAREVSLRVSFAARRIGEEWRLVSAHYTPVRAVGPDGAR
jgi:ketosteroid isomerase-like protein